MCVRVACVHHCTSVHCQDFYSELLQGDYRETRFLELGKQAGMSEKTLDRQLSAGKVSPASFT